MAKKLNCMAQELSATLTAGLASGGPKREQLEPIEALHAITIALNSSRNLDDLLDRFLTNFEQLIPQAAIEIMLLEGGLVKVVGRRGYPKPDQLSVDCKSYLLTNISTLHHIFETKQPCVIADTVISVEWEYLPEAGWARSFMGIPLCLREQVIGFLSLLGSLPQQFGPVNINLMTMLGHYAALAIENTRLQATEQEQAVLAEVLQEISAALNATLDFNSILDRLLEQVTRLVPYDTGTVFLVKQGYAHVVRTRGHEQLGAEIAEAAAHLSFDLATTPNLKWMFETKQPLIISDTVNDAGWLKGPPWSHVRSWAGVPILGQGEVVAFFSLDKVTPHYFQPKHIKHLAIFASQAGLALENARLFEAEARRHYEAEALSRATLALTSTISMGQLLDRILAELQHVVPYDSATVQLLKGDQLEIICGRGFPNLSELIGITFPIQGYNPNTLAIKLGKPIIIDDVATDYPAFNEKPHAAAHIRSWLGVPLLISNRNIGMLALDKQEPNFYTEAHARMAITYAIHAAIAINNAYLFDETRRQAHQLAILNQLAREMTGLMELKELCSFVTERIYSAFNYANVAIFTADLAAQKLILQSISGVYASYLTPDETTLTIGQGIIGQAAQTGKVIIANDTQHQLSFFQFPNSSIRSQVALPLKMEQQLLGVLNIDSNHLNAFDESVISALTTVADQLAITLEKARLFAETSRRAEQLEALRLVSQNLTELRDLDTLLRQIAQQAIQLLGGNGCGIYLYRSEGQVLEAVVEEWAPHNSLPGETNLAREIRPWADPKFSFVSAPIQTGREALGLLNVTADNKRRHFTSEDKALLSQFAAQAAIAIENARLYEQAQHHTTELERRVAERTFELQTLYELAQSLGQATQLGDVVRLIMLHLYQVVPYDVAASLLVTEASGTLVIQSQHPLAPMLEAELQEMMTTPLKQELANKPLNFRRIQPKTDPVTRLPLTSLASMIQVPIILDQTPVGLLLIAAEQQDKFSQEHNNLVRTVADQAADSIRRLQSLLAAEHRRLENLVAHLPTGLLLVDARYRIVLANPAGWQYLAELNPIFADEQLTYLGDQPIETILTASSSPVKKEIELAGPPLRIFAVIAEPISVGPEAGGWLLAIGNETETRIAQERIKQQERLAAVGQLAAGIAHDFNNILTSMIGFAELVRMQPDIHSTAKEDLQKVINQGQRAAHLVRQILDFSRQSIAEKRAIDLVPFLKEAIKLLERTIPENIGIRLEIDSPQEAYLLNADPAQIQQVLTNLAVNARDAMPNGGKLQFRLSNFILTPTERPPLPEMSPGSWVVLTVSDTGTGISAEVLPRVFEPFFTTKEVGKGTGLGLAQVYGIITQHSGYIDVETQVDKGTSFKIYLPQLAAVPKNHSQLQEIETNQGHGEVLLLVEDNLDVLEVTQAMLVHLGYRVVTATNGQQALQIFNQYQHEIALVLTDLTMPHMGGVALSQALRSQNPNVKVVVLTGYPLETESKEVLNQGIVDWLQKPLNRQQLAQTVSRSLKLDVHPKL